MSKKIRLFCVVISVIMISSLPLLTGCNGGSGGKKEVADFKGQSIKIATWSEEDKPELGKSDGGDARYYAFEQAKEKFDAEIEWVITTQEDHFNKFVQSSLSGQVYADILLSHSWNHISLIQKGLLLPTDNFIKNADDPDKWEQSLCKINDICYGLSVKPNIVLPKVNLFYNRTILKSLGLDDPQELAKKDKWTWDKFREYCKVATNEKTANFGVSSFGLMDVLNSTNNCTTVVNDNGKYYNGFTHGDAAKRNLEVLELIKSLSDDKSLSGEWVQGFEAMDDALNDFLDGKLLFQFAQDGSKLKQYEMTGYGVVTAPMGPSSDGKFYNAEASYVYWSLPKESEFTDKDRAAFWMYANTTWDSKREKAYYDFDLDEYKEDLQAKEYDSAEDVQFLFDMAEKNEVIQSPSFDLAVSLGALVANDIYGEVIRGTESPSSAIAKKDNEIQAKIDAALNVKESETTTK